MRTISEEHRALPRYTYRLFRRWCFSQRNHTLCRTYPYAHSSNGSLEGLSGFASLSYRFFLLFFRQSECFDDGSHDLGVFARKICRQFFKQGTLLVRQILHIELETVHDVYAASVSLRSVNRVLQREAQHVIFNCAFAYTELERKILSCFVPASAKNFQYRFAPLVYIHRFSPPLPFLLVV